MQRAFTVFSVMLFVAASSRAERLTRVAARLVADQSAVVAGEPFRVGVLFTIPDNAHIYWINPGESGLPTEISWELPVGFSAGTIEWPAPTAIRDAVLNETTFGYEKEVLIFAGVTPPDDLAPGASVTLRAKASWLVCLESSECIPEEASLELALPVAGDAAPSPKLAMFDDYASRTPRAPAESTVPVEIVTAGADAPSVRVRLSGPWRVDPMAVEFFPDRGAPWRRVQSKDAGSRDSEAAFVPVGKFDGPVSGAITLASTNAETGDVRRLYLRVGAPLTRKGD